MRTLAIIADDLTGALDSAAPLCSFGKVAVATGIGAFDRAISRGARVVAVSTRSRGLPPDLAHDRAADALRRLPPGTRLFKKVDSRLKGNIAAELSALPDRPLFVAPAIPDFGRVVRGGRLTGFGVDRPIDIAAVLGDAARRATIPDTETQAQLAAALRAAPPEAILVGARGLAQALGADRSDQGAAPPGLVAPVRIAMGTTDPISLAQMAALRAELPGLFSVAAPAGRVPAPAGPPAPVTLLQMTEGEQVSPDIAAARFAAGVAPWLAGPGTMVLAGGATAEAILDRLGIDVLDLAGEVLPGLPISRAGSACIVTKSGGFGAPDTLVRLVAMAQKGGLCHHG